MSTSVTPDEFLAALTKWGVKWRFYKDRADWLAHNRNGASNNQVTPGGFGPLRGVAVHNTAGATTPLSYLYDGDPARSLPGPLCNWAVQKDGTVVLMGWGTCNATGPGDPKPDSLVRKNAMPLDSEITPVVGSLTDPRAILYAPYYLGFEAIYGDEGPTAAQRDAMVRTTCAALDAMGGPANGYGAGSVVMHRELTTQRSDPQGWTRDGAFRRAVAAMFKNPPTTSGGTVPSAPQQVTTTLRSNFSNVGQGGEVTLTATVSPAVDGTVDFIWQKPDGSWGSVGSAPASGGRAVVKNVPWNTVRYGAAFKPADPTKYAGSGAPSIVVEVIDVRAALDALKPAQTPPSA